MSFVPPVRARPPGSGFKAPIVKSQQANPESATKNPDLSDKILPEKNDPDNSTQSNDVSKSGLSQGTFSVLFPALYCHVLHLSTFNTARQVIIYFNYSFMVT